jgi:maltose alpha-D-glucosyltransferase/alpha-amylase
MQWTPERHGGFSTARRTVRPVISDPIYGYQRVNVQRQRRDPSSFLNWMERKIRMRRECPEIGWGNWEILEVDAPGVLVMHYEWNGRSLVILHNFSSSPRAVRLPAKVKSPVLIDLLWSNDSRGNESGRHVVRLQPYDYRWFRVYREGMQ